MTNLVCCYRLIKMTCCLLFHSESDEKSGNMIFRIIMVFVIILHIRLSQSFMCKIINLHIKLYLAELLQ